MGLIKEGERFAVLSDILGDEDHLGDMDFKVAGTPDGITALQMDIKITSITEEIMSSRAAPGARTAASTSWARCPRRWSALREEVAAIAPRVTTIRSPRTRSGEVIGTGGKVIREITEQTGTKIDIEDDGTINVATVDAAAGQKAIDWIKGIVAGGSRRDLHRQGREVRRVRRLRELPGLKDGLVHISELAPRRVAKVNDVVKEGDQVKVKVLGVDDRGKVRRP